MKPKGLKASFSWEERRPLIHQGVLFVPEYYDKHHEWAFPGWESPLIFGKEGPVCMEYCSGNGAWIVDKAIQEPNKLWVAVELQFERVRKIWSKKCNFNLSNLFIVCGEALTFTRHYVPSASIHEMYINFPDPWPKTKHAKNRLIQAPFVEEMAKAAKGGAQLILATDDVPYREQMVKEIIHNSFWKSKLQAPYWIGDFPNYGTSYFDELWRNKGRQIHYLHYERIY